MYAYCFIKAGVRILFSAIQIHCLNKAFTGCLLTNVLVILAFELVEVPIDYDIIM